MVYSCTMFHENILNGIKVIVRTLLSWEKFQSSIFPVELRFFSSAHRLMMVYICTKFNENILDGIRFKERTRFS